MDINIKLIFAIFASIVGVFAFIPYIKDIFLRKTKPHAYTWLVWTITQGTAVAGLWYGKAGWGSLALSIGTAFVFFIFLLSLKYGARNITKGDTIVLIAALSAILIWWQLHNPLLAVLMVSLIDFLGYLPSFRKTFKEPWTETVKSWVLFVIINIFSILALNEYNLLTLTYITTMTIANIAMVIISVARRRVRSKPSLI